MENNSMCQYTLEDFVDNGHECPTCGKVLDTELGMKTHHAKVHGESIATESIECHWCGDSFHLNTSIAEQSKRHFCGDECLGQWRSENSSGSDHPQSVNHLSKTCGNCGSEFEVPPSWDDREYCSQECYAEVQSTRTGKDNPQWEGAELICERCGDTFEVSPSREDTAKFCSLECLHDSRSDVYGPEHPLWTNGKGVYRSIRNSLGPKAWPSIAQDVRDEYGNECELCGKSREENGRALSAHHIVPIMAGGDNGDYNLIPLCQTCHHRVERYTESILEIEPVLVE